jgi:DNA invertase Pin-like site-specific DNA recombinase
MALAAHKLEHHHPQAAYEEAPVAVGYLRVSSDHQAEKNLSIPSQERLIQEYAERQGFRLLRYYRDDGESALSAHRPGFQEMVAATKPDPPPFTKILVWKFSRFARNREDSILYKAMLKRRGVEVVSISEPVDDTPTGKLLEGILETVDEFYSLNLAHESLRGMVENARRGYRNGGNAPFGYRLVPVTDERGNRKSKLEVDEVEARLVRRMFEMVTQGHGLKAVAMALNREGAQTRTGAKWGSGQVSSILNNEAHIGWTVFNKKDRKLPGKVNRPRSDWVIVEDTHEPIVDEELFNAVQERLTSRRTRNSPPARSGSSWLLSGLVSCGQCGAAFGISDYGRKKAYRYCQCITYIKKGREICPGRRLRVDHLEAAVIGRLKDHLLTDANLERIAEDLNRVLEQMSERGADRLSRLRRANQEVAKRLQRQYEALEAGAVNVDEVGERIRALQAEREALAKEIEELGRVKSSRGLKVNVDDLKQYRKQLFEVLRGDGIDEQRAFLGQFIRRAVVGREKVKLIYTRLSKNSSYN